MDGKMPKTSLVRNLPDKKTVNIEGKKGGVSSMGLIRKASAKKSQTNYGETYRYDIFKR